ncbi:MAG: PaaX family transcriptional regulator [Carbonactinosporaceae bacterium]
MVTPMPRPRSLILTVYGAFVRDLGGWIAIADLIQLMSGVGVDAQAVRSSISRLKRRGTVVAHKRDGPRGNAVGYALSHAAWAIFAEGDRRIYGGVQPARRDDGWVLAVFSVPESQREQRHVLRSRLAWLGFGNTAAGVWVAPAHLLDDARATLERLGLTRYVHLFRADYVDFADPREAVGQWWDLDALQRMYGTFLDTYRPMLRRWHGETEAGPGQRGDARAYRDYVVALTEWRRLPYLDPGLPSELLPPDWNAAKAARLFAELTELLHEPGLRHVQEITGLSRVVAVR